MAKSACGAPVGGSARESNHAPAKGTIRAAELPPQTRAQRRHEHAMCARLERVQAGWLPLGKRNRLKFSVTSHRTGEAAQRYHGDGRPRAGLLARRTFPKRSGTIEA